MDEKTIRQTTTTALPLPVHIKNPEKYSLLFGSNPPAIQNSPPNSWSKRLNKRIGKQTVQI